MIKKKVLKDLLWECYGYLLANCGVEGDDFLTSGSIELLTAKQMKRKRLKLKKKIREIFNTT